MFYVCQIKDNLLGQMDECEDLISALDLVQKIVKENGVDLSPDVLTEINEDWSYLGDDWSVCVGTPN
jgi:hypothetical protein